MNDTAMNDMKNRTVFIAGASRGIGAAIARGMAAAGANVVIAAKSDAPHPKLPGTIHTVAAECEQLGGRALPVRVDLRDIEGIRAAVDKAVATFGGIDVLVANASVQTFTKTPDTAEKQWDMLFDINVKGTFFTGQACLPHLAKSSNPQILVIASAMNHDPRWYAERLPRTMSKYGMSMLVIGWAEEFKEQGISVNGLWPRHAIATDAILYRKPEMYEVCRKPEIMADAARWIVTRPRGQVTGRFFFDDEALAEAGLSQQQIDAYWKTPGKKSGLSSFIDFDQRPFA
jgi:citronellol/citronellal dehydrogenase